MPTPPPDDVTFGALRPGESEERDGVVARRTADAVAVDLPDGRRVTVPLTATGARGAAEGGTRVLVLGGTRSGKSSYAERRLADAPAVTYVATAFARPDDPEWVVRVAAHRARRPPHWVTVETGDVAGVLAAAAPGDAVLVDCMSLWLGGVLDDPSLPERTDALLDAWRATRATVVAVSSEVGLGVVPPTEIGRRYRDALGMLNARLAADADEVWLVTAGIPRRLQ